VWSEALCPQISPIVKIAIRRDAAHLRRSSKGDRGFQIESGTSVILKLDEECGQFVIIHEPYPPHSFAFQLWVFNAFVVQNLFRLLGVLPWAGDYLAEMKYKPKPRFAAGFLIPDGDSERDTVVGRLLPQPLVTSTGGSEQLLDDLLGDGFGLIWLASDAMKIAALADLPSLQRLNLRLVISGSTAQPVPPCFTVVHDQAGGLTRLLSKRPSRCFLIRPDRYVAASLDVADIEASRRQLAELVL